MTEEEKIASMRQAYPSLALKSDGSGGILVWEGELTPLRTLDEIDGIIYDLAHDRNVEISGGVAAQIVHDQSCQIVHQRSPLAEQLSDPFQTFTVQITDFGTTRQPEATILSAAAPTERMRHRWKESGVCAYAPWKYPWDPDSSSILDFVDQVFIWLLKQTVYLQTETWLGSEMPHDSKFLLTTVKPSDRCVCGSGKRFEDCCRDAHARAVYRDLWLNFEAWLSRCNDRRLDRLGGANSPWRL
jgi:hypothetical protein